MIAMLVCVDPLLTDVAGATCAQFAMNSADLCCIEARSSLLTCNQQMQIGTQLQQAAAFEREKDLAATYAALRQFHLFVSIYIRRQRDALQHYPAKLTTLHSLS